MLVRNRKEKLHRKSCVECKNDTHATPAVKLCLRQSSICFFLEAGKTREKKRWGTSFCPAIVFKQTTSQYKTTKVPEYSPRLNLSRRKFIRYPYNHYKWNITQDKNRSSNNKPPYSYYLVIHLMQARKLSVVHLISHQLFVQNKQKWVITGSQQNSSLKAQLLQTISVTISVNLLRHLVKTTAMAWQFYQTQTNTTKQMQLNIF